MTKFSAFLRRLKRLCGNSITGADELTIGYLCPWRGKHHGKWKRVWIFPHYMWPIKSDSLQLWVRVCSGSLIKLLCERECDALFDACFESVYRICGWGGKGQGYTRGVHYPERRQSETEVCLRFFCWAPILMCFSDCNCDCVRVNGLHINCGNKSQCRNCLESGYMAYIHGKADCFRVLHVAVGWARECMEKGVFWIWVSVTRSGDPLCWVFLL